MRLWHFRTMVVQHLPVCGECPMSDAVRDTPARLFLCACCRSQVVVCSHCDRGQHYCADGCSSLNRKRLQREAGRRYQGSLRGRHKHAQRMRRLRDRRRAQANKVTHQGSLGTGADDVLTASQTTEPLCLSLPCIALRVPASASTFARTSALALCRCRFCGVQVLPLVRPGYLRRGRGAEPWPSP
jgi:hypothetical protein